METPEGLRWLHQLVLVAHFSITLQGAGGIRVVCQFLELSGLSAFVGASYGTQQGLNAALEEALVAVAEEQRAALARGMPHRDLTVRCAALSRSVPWNDGFGHIPMRYGSGALRTDAAHHPCAIASLRPWT
jgi:hypothetical protein